MSKIIDIQVDMHFDNINRLPSIYVTFDAIDYSSLLFTEQNHTFLGIQDDLAVFYYHQQPDSGFGGRHFHIKMIDGSDFTLQGPWSSNSAHVNEMFPESQVVECTIVHEGQHFGGAVLIEPLSKILRARGFRCGLVNTGYGIFFQPLLNNGQSKDHSPVVKEF